MLIIADILQISDKVLLNSKLNTRIMTMDGAFEKFKFAFIFGRYCSECLCLNTYFLKHKAAIELLTVFVWTHKNPSFLAKDYVLAALDCSDISFNP